MDRKPCRQRERDLLVFPWAGIVTHIPGTCDPELAAQQIEQYFSEFEPQNVSIVARTSDKVWQVAVVQFKGDIHGYMNSVALDGFFQRSGRGRHGWARGSLPSPDRQIGGTPADWSLYGWMASKDDLIAGDELSMHLSKRGILSTVAGVVEEVVQRSVNDAETRALKKAGELENQAVAWKSGHGGGQEVVVTSETKHLEPLMSTLITKLEGVTEALSTSSASTSDEELCLATVVLQRHGPSPGISFKHYVQLGPCGLNSENFDHSHGDQPSSQLEPCGSLGFGGPVSKDFAKLLRLKQEWGDEVFQKFMTVLADSEGSNGTKRFGGTAVAWNTAENRKATLLEVIKGLEQVIEAKDAARKTRNTEQKDMIPEYGKLHTTKVIQLAEEELRRDVPPGEVNQDELKRKNGLIEITKQELERKTLLIANIKDQLSESIELIRTSREDVQRKNSLIEAQNEELQLRNQDLEAAREELRRKDTLINAKDLLIEARRNAIEKKDYLNKTLSLELKLKNHLLEAKREEVRRKDLWIRARGLDSTYPGDVKEPILIEDEPTGMSQVFTLMETDADAERRYPKRTRN